MTAQERGIDRLTEVRAVVDSILLRQKSADNLRCGLIHLYGVSTLCAALAQRRGLDVETCAIAGMLHDIASYETGDSAGHAERSAARAEEILRATGHFSPAEIATIRGAISPHSGKVRVDGSVAELLKDADVLQFHLLGAGVLEVSERTRRLQCVLRELGYPVAPAEARTGTMPASSGLPGYFGLQRYSVSPRDVMGMALRCDPSRIRRDVLLTPVWSHETFLSVCELEETVAPDLVYSLRYNGRSVTLIRSGVGAPLAGDAMLALGCTPCARVVFVGSVGGLVAGMTIGDLVIPSESVSGDGFSAYLPEGSLTPASFLAPAAPSRELTEALEQAALAACPERGASLSRGRVFSTDSIIAQFHHLDEISERYGCIGIEMETAAVFRAAALVGVPAAALLQVSDLPRLGRSLFSGRTEEDRRRRRRLRSELLPRIALDVLTAPRGRAGALGPGSSGEERNA